MPSTFTFEEALEAPPTTFDFEEAKQPDPEQPAPVEVPQEPTRARSRLSRFGSGFKEELIARPTTTSVPFLGGAVDFVDALTVYNAAKRVSKADTDGSEPSDKDLMVLKQFSDEQNRRRNLEGAEKVGSMVGGILLQLPAFAGELMATGGLYTVGRKIGQKAALKTAEKFIENASEKALVKYGSRIAGGMAGTALQAPAAGAQRIAAETVQRMTPQIAAGEDEAGKLRAIIKDNGDDFGPAVARALGSQYVEVLSEHSGGMAGEVLGKVPGVAALQRLKEKVIAKWFQTHPSATIDELLKQLKERGAWHGMVNEMIEERLGEIGRIPIEGEYRPPDKEQLAAEAIGFSIPGAAAYGLRKLTGRKEPPDAIPERTPTPLPVGETPEDRPPLVPQVRQQTEATTSPVAPVNPGGPVADLPPDLKAIEAENAAKQRKIADDFKAETERKKAATTPAVSVQSIPTSDFITAEPLQPRADNFSEATASKVATEGFNPQENAKSPPLIWRDPNTGKLYRAGGSSRAEGLRRLGDKAPENVDVLFSTAPTKEAAFEEAISNNMVKAAEQELLGTAPASVNAPKETAGAPPTTVSGEQSPAAPIKPPTAAPDTRTAIEVLNQEKRVKVKMPSGATMLRVTTPDGKVSVQPLTNVVKGDNVFRGSGGSKVEAGAIDRFGKFLPSKGEVAVSRVEPPNPYKTDESEKNSERARSLKAKEVVVETEQEALDAMNRTREANGQEPLKSASLENGVAAYYDNGVIYYILDGIKSPEQFLAVQREEIAHHINSSEQAKKVLSELGRAKEFELERREIRGSYPQVQGETDAQYSERIANEMLAKSRVQDKGLFQRMMDWIIEKLSNVARIGNWIKESDANRQAILRTISRRLESNFTAAGQTNVPLAAQATTESDEAENVRAQRGGIPEVGQERPSERIDEIRATVRELGFDGRVTITPENTERAWALFEAMTDPTRRGATAQELKNQFGGTDMALGLLKNELEQYAFKLTAAGDRSLLVSMLNRSADFVTVLEGGDTAAARAMRAALEAAEGPAWRGLKAVLTEERNRAAAQGLRLEASNYERLMRALDTFTVSEEEIVKAAREIPLPEGQTVGQAETVPPPTTTEGQPATQPGTTEATPTTPGTRRLRLSVTELAKRLLKTPYRSQLDPAWREQMAREFFEEAGLSPEEAAAAAKDFSARFADVYAKAQERLAKQILKGSTPDTVSDVLKAIRAGVLDPKSPWADEFAKKAGWKKPTDEQIKRLLELDAKLSEEGISPAEVAAINEQMLQIVRLVGKHEAGFMKAMAERFVGGMLSGIRTITVQLAPIITTIRDLAIASGSDPKNTLNFARAIYEAAKNNIVSESKFAWQKDAYKFHLGELDLEHNQLKRIWQEAEEQYRKGGVRQKAWARTRQLFAINRFVFKTLNTIDNTMMSAVREWKVAYYASIAFKEAGINTRQIGELVDAMAMARQASFERWTDVGLDPTTAKVRANNDVLQAASDFIENRTGDENVALRVLDSAEKDAYSMVGRRAQGIAEADEGMLSRLFMNPFMEWQSKMRGEGGARGLIATALFGFVNIPYRTARFVSNFHPYGLLRYGINAYRNNRGMEPYWKQTFGNSMQERARLREAIAGTVVLGLATAWGMAFSSADDDDDKEGFRLYITGAGPKNKNLRDAWLKRGFKPYAMNFVVNGRHVTIPLTRVGETLMFPFMIPAALDDAAWRQKEAAAAGRPIKSPISLYTSSLVGTHLSMAGQKGLFQTAGRLMDSVQGGDSFLKASAKLGATVGSSIALPYRQMLASISEMFVGPLDQSSASALIAANMPIVGLPFQSKAVNRFGDQINDRSWYGRIFNTGVPVAFQVSKTPENETLYPAMVSGGFAPPELRRYILEERFGPLTNDEFSTFARKSGARLKADTLNNLPTLNAVAPDDVKKWLSQAATRADRQTELEMGLQRVNPLRAGGSAGGFSPILSSGGGNALPAASSARGGASGRTMASFGGGFGGSRRRRTSLRSFRTRGRSRLRRTRISRLSRRTRLRRPRLTASRIRRPRLSLA